MIDVKNKYLKGKTVIVSTDIDDSGTLTLNASGIVSVSEEVAAKLVKIPNWMYSSVPEPGDQENLDTFDPVNGRTVFVLSKPYKPGTTKVFINGVLQRYGTHYFESSIQSITLTSAITGADTVTVFYEER